MPKFPVDAPSRRVVKALQALGFRLVREGNHIAMVRENPDGTTTPLTMPAHPTIIVCLSALMHFCVDDPNGICRG
jgi:predicted RNA binding protein YcfA (HicA-like mRNA interferase family)